MMKTFLSSGLCLLSVFAGGASASEHDHVALRKALGPQRRELENNPRGPYNGAHGVGGNSGGGGSYSETRYDGVFGGNVNGNGGGGGGGNGGNGGGYGQPNCRSGGERWCPSLNQCVSISAPCPPSGTNCRAGERFCGFRCISISAPCPGGGGGGGGGGHDCRGGERWCEALNQCVSISGPCGFLPPIGGDVDQYGCRPSAGYEWCAARQECIRPFETHCGGHSVACPYNYDPVWCGGGNKYLNLCQAEVDGYYEADCTRYPGEDYYNNVCPLPIDAGDCYGSHTSTPAWGYDSYTGYCEAFEWCGNGGNGNRFESLQRCEENCGDMGGDHQGPGHGPVVCGAVHDPVWCNDGTGEYEYSNLCQAVNDGFYEGQCMSYPAGQHNPVDPYVCPTNHNPVWCGEYYQHEYTNLCRAEAEGYYQADCTGGHDGIGCATVYEPVCCDGYNYSNLCQAEVDGQYPQQCTNGVCGGGGHDGSVCPAVYDPVCCDGYDYSNLCEAEVDGYYPQQCNNGVCGGGGGGGHDWDNQCPDFCFAPLVAGNCYANIPKWGYDAQKGRCKEFTYGGCGGNRNNFDTEYDCDHKCGQC